MKKAFCIYPHCYLTVVDNKTLAYNPQLKTKIESKSIDVAHRFSKTSSRICNYEQSSGVLVKFMDECVAKNIGYYISYDSVLPFCDKYELQFISSLEKVRKAKGFNDGYHVVDFISSITILCANNSYIAESEDVYKQLNYPHYDSMVVCTFDFGQIFENNYFSSLLEIVIAGDIDDYLLNTLYSIINLDIQIVIRTVYRTHYNIQIANLLQNSNNVMFELILEDKKALIDNIEFLNNERIINIPIIKNISDIPAFDVLEFKNYKPVIFNLMTQNELINEMLIDENDIVNSNIGIDDIYTNEYLNSSIFGHIDIDSSGNVSCRKDYIGNLKKHLIADLLNTWINNENSLWFKSRNKKAPCKSCVFSALCPPISIYEELGFLNAACKRVPKI